MVLATLVLKNINRILRITYQDTNKSNNNFYAFVETHIAPTMQSVLSYQHITSLGPHLYKNIHAHLAINLHTKIQCKIQHFHFLLNLTKKVRINAKYGRR